MLLSTYTVKIRVTRGFSILEVLITAAIIGFITALILVKYGAFNNSVLLQSQAYEIAIDMREVQVFSVSVLGTGREEYGLYFNIDTPDRYLDFRDVGAATPALYDPGEQIGDAYNIDSRFVINRICVNSCNVDGSENVNDISITFRRPDFDARLGTSGGGTINSARIDLVSVVDSTAVRSIQITATGQIDVD